MWDEKHSFVPERSSRQCTRGLGVQIGSKANGVRGAGPKLGLWDVEHKWWKGRYIHWGLRGPDCCDGDVQRNWTDPRNGHLPSTGAEPQRVLAGRTPNPSSVS